MTHSFKKYSGAGNNFIVLDTYQAPLSLSQAEMKDLVKKACSYQEGIGSDGLILINQSSRAPFSMAFYNPDGSYGALCGNGARCAVLAAKEFGLTTSDQTEFEVLDAINRGVILPNDTVRVQFQDPGKIKTNFMLRLGVKLFATTSYVDLGSQHAIVFFEDLSKFTTDTIEDFDIRYYGSMVRWHPDFAPKGVNANFAQICKDEEGEYIRIRTFERGVEGETLACGTGSMSTAIAAYLTKRVVSMPIRLKTQSEEYITAGFTVIDNHISNLWLEGKIARLEGGTFIFDPESRNFEAIWNSELR